MNNIENIVAEICQIKTDLGIKSDSDLLSYVPKISRIEIYAIMGYATSKDNAKTMLSLLVIEYRKRFSEDYEMSSIKKMTFFDIVKHIRLLKIELNMRRDKEMISLFGEEDWNTVKISQFMKIKKLTEDASHVLESLRAYRKST